LLYTIPRHRSPFLEKEEPPAGAQRLSDAKITSPVPRVAAMV
jgi:hypothetical protein